VLTSFAATVASSALALGAVMALSMMASISLTNILTDRYLKNKEYVDYERFARSIEKIAKKVGDRIAAFRIVDSKIPQNVGDIKRPLRFYTNEIDDFLENGKINGRKYINPFKDDKFWMI